MNKIFHVLFSQYPAKSCSPENFPGPLRGVRLSFFAVVFESALSKIEENFALDITLTYALSFIAEGQRSGQGVSDARRCEFARWRWLISPARRWGRSVVDPRRRRRGAGHQPPPVARCRVNHGGVRRPLARRAPVRLAFCVELPSLSPFFGWFLLSSQPSGQDRHHTLLLLPVSMSPTTNRRGEPCNSSTRFPEALCLGF